jgi:hypothetical protein
MDQQFNCELDCALPNAAHAATAWVPGQCEGQFMFGMSQRLTFTVLSVKVH